MKEQIGNSVEHLGVEAALVCARAQEALEWSLQIRLEAGRTHQKSAELIAASREVMLQCRANREGSAARTQIARPSEPERLEMVNVFVHMLGKLGFPAFIVQPSQDTAIQV